MLTTNLAKALRLKNYGLEVGQDADSVANVILNLPARLVVLKRDKVIAKSEHIRSLGF